MANTETAPTYQIRGRRIDQDDLAVIREFIAHHWNECRAAISRLLCRHWQWCQANGHVKDQDCRVMLLHLEKKGEITLPPRKKESFRYPKKAERRSCSIDSTELAGAISDFSFLTIEMVRRTP